MSKYENCNQSTMNQSNLDWTSENKGILETNLRSVKSKRPLIHHITNYVTVNDCANMTLCAGGSPVMTDAIDDVVEITSISNALVLNIGTLNPRTVESMFLSGSVAGSKGVPVVFDPVGAGATSYRTTVSRTIIDKMRPQVIKGNAGEIGVLSGLGGKVRGVDSAESVDVSSAVKELAKKSDCIVVATGPVDYVSDGETVMELSNGTPMQDRLSGTGCMLSSVVGCYVGALGPSLESVISAITIFNIAAEDAASHCNGPGTFKTAFLDSMTGIDGKILDSRARIKASSNRR